MRFPGAVEESTGIHPELPSRLADLFTRPERFQTLANDMGRVTAYLNQQLAARSAP